MKKAIFLAAVLLALLTAGCLRGEPNDIPITETPAEPSAVTGTEQLPELPLEIATLTCRIVRIDGNSLLLLRSSGLYTLTLGDAELLDEQLMPLSSDNLVRGMLVEVGWNGTILETYPAIIGTPKYIHVKERGADLVGLYLTVISDLYDVDPGLNSDIEMMAFDLSALENLSFAEKNALLYLVGNKYGVYTFEATFDELREQGLITGSFGPYKDDEPVEMPHFELGISIAFTDTEFKEDEFSFSVSKWRSALGAYFFADCTAEKQYMSSGVEWVYEIGSQAIS